MPASNLFRSGRLCLWLWLLFWCAGCERLTDWPPHFYFSRYPVHHSLDLSKILGQEARLLSSQDTLELRIQHQPATGLTLITDAVTGDTLQQVWVTRYRHLYYFTWPINDTCYWVHAVRIRRGQVQGLGLDGAYYQLHQLDKAVRAGQFPELMQRQDSASGLMEIRFEPNKLQKFYAGVLDSLPVYHLESSLAHLHTTISTPPTPPTQYRAEPLFCRMYPNPAADILTLQPANDGLYEVTILDMLAKPVQVGSVSKGIATVRVQHLPVGRYVVWVREETTGRVTKQQLLIER